MTSQTKDRVAFGQSLSVNAVQMAAAVNTIANGGVRIAPSLIRGTATTDEGVAVGTDNAAATRVVSEQAARQTARMMERVTPRAPASPRWPPCPATSPPARPAPRSASRRRAAATTESTTVSFGGFAPADDPRFTVYVAVHSPGIDGGGATVAGPAFSRILGYALGRYGVPPTDGKPSRLPVEW